MQDIIQWLQNYGDNIVYIYGSIDPYTAAAIELTGSANAIKIIQSGASHSIKINSLDEKQKFYNALNEWLDVNIQ